MSIQTRFVCALSKLFAVEKGMLQETASVQLVLLQYVEVAKVFDLVCHSLSSIKLKPDPIIPGQRHQGI